ncbi:hypothetical protein [Streptomyces sp. YIM 121038]|uniref:hypothetical protein n=1 Tax=Streptomyces sp. YIM 121038 TaxID=2136401 RepID=UPI001486859E|nr:hypothetical protein [Streptomyces sp. YIM 121038]
MPAPCPRRPLARGRTFGLRPLRRCHTGRIPAGLLRAGLLLPPGEVLRLASGVLAQPILADAPPLAVGQAGQLPVGAWWNA